MTRILILFLLFGAGTGFTQEVKVTPDAAGRKVNITIDDRPFTSYIYTGSEFLKKPVLFPVFSPNGALITRGWPLAPRTGERVDHPHHIGIWFNYENVNKNDFWNNSGPVRHTPGKKYGSIVHTGITSVTSGSKQGELNVTADWIDHDGKILLKEKSRYVFRAQGSYRIIDRIIHLTAPGDTVYMPDIKDGMFAIRVARELELPYDTPQRLTDRSGNPSLTPVRDNEKVSGNYRNKEGVKGDDVWGTRSAWCMLSGKIGDETVSVSIIDHPANPGYPAYWHARGYGLFAANPIGRKAFDKNKEPLNFKIPKGQSATFRFRTVIASEVLPDRQMNRLAAEFASQP